MIQNGHTVESFFEFVDYLVVEDSERRKMGLSTNVLAYFDLKKRELKGSDILPAIGWKVLRAWMKLCSAFAEHDISIQDIKSYYRKARKVELENMNAGRVGGG